MRLELYKGRPLDVTNGACVGRRRASSAPAMPNSAAFPAQLRGASAPSRARVNPVATREDATREDVPPRFGPGLGHDGHDRKVSVEHASMMEARRARFWVTRRRRAATAPI